MSPICPEIGVASAEWGAVSSLRQGHVFRVERARGPAWYAKYRLPDGRQVQRELLDDARRGTLPGLVRTGATFEDAAAEYLRYIEHDRGRKPSTVRGYRSAITAHLLPAFGSLPVESVTAEVIEQWVAAR